MQKDNRWLFTPAISAGVNLKKLFLRDVDKVTNWALRGSWARIGRYQDNNRFAAGPQYTGEELTGIGQPVMSSYYGYASIAPVSYTHLLSLTKELLELHHGTISVESEVGRGSSFTVIIPIDKESYTEAEINVESSQELKRESGIGTVNAENNILDWKQLEEGDLSLIHIFVASSLT